MFPPFGDFGRRYRLIAYNTLTLHFQIKDHQLWYFSARVATTTRTSAFAIKTLIYCIYTTSFLSPESYSSNVQVGNLQLPNYLHSSEDMGKFHRPEKKNHKDLIQYRIEGIGLKVQYLLVKCLEVVWLLLRESSHR